MVLKYEEKQEDLLIGYSFNRDALHRVHLYINPGLGFINIRVNGTESIKYYKSLYFNLTFRPSDQALATYRLGHSISIINKSVFLVVIKKY